MNGPADGEQLRIECLAAAEHVGTVRRAITGFAADHGASELQQDNVALAVSEAATNVVLHAYRHLLTPGPLYARAWMQDHVLHVAIVDHGTGMSPRRSDSPGAGLGLGVIAAIADSVTLDASEHPGVRLTLTFALAPT
jgi:serine/threonine-protein kinase RsbW